MNLERWRERVNQINPQHRYAVDWVEREKLELEQAREQVRMVEESQKVLQNVAQTIQQTAHERIASVITRCLEAVFDDPYTFRIQFEQKRGRTEASLVFVKGEHELDPCSASGCGVLDVAAFGLRLACLLLSRPQRRRLLVLDEPFKFLSSPVYRERVRDLLETLSEEMGVQIIMVTQTEELQAGVVVRLD